jgi:hypothetical protein
VAEILKLLEVNLAVRKIEDAMPKFVALGLREMGIWNVEHPPVETRTTSFPIGDSNLSLIEPLVDRDPVARFLAKFGEGIFSLTLLVDGIEELMTQWRQADVDFVLQEPLEMRNVRIVGHRIPVVLENWTRPSTLHGTVIELQDHRDATGKRYGAQVVDDLLRS